MDEQLKKKLRNFKVDVSQFLLVLSTTDAFALELGQISSSTSTPEANLKGVISTLRRTKVKGQPIIKGAGKDSDGRYRWRINESVVKKNELVKFLEEEVLGKESIKWAKK